MKLFRKIEGDTPGEEFARRSIERAGAVMTGAPVVCLLAVLVLGAHVELLAVAAYFVALGVAEGVAALIYLGLRKIRLHGIRSRAAYVPVPA